MRPESFLLFPVRSLETKQRDLAHRLCHHHSADSASFSHRLSVDSRVPMYPRVNPDALPAPGSLEMGHATHAVAYPPLPPTAEVVPVPVIQQRHGGRAPDRSSCEDRDPSTLLVGATLITMLAFLLGSSVPGGYWPQDTPSGDGSGRLYRAGDPIMRDLHRPRYWVFRVASWAGVASSMVLTLSLLVRMAVASRHVRWSFAVAYASLLLTFAASQTRTHLSLDILLCLAVLLVSWLITSVREENRACVMKVLCCSSSRDS